MVGINVLRNGLLLAAGLSLLCLAGCGSSALPGLAIATSANVATSNPASNSRVTPPTLPTSSAPPSAKASTATPSGLQTYESVQAIADALSGSNLICTGLIDDNAPSIAVEQGRCRYRGVEIVLAVYTSTTERTTAVDNITGLLGEAKIEFGVLSGGNWMVNCGNEATCLVIRPAVGGKLNSGKGS